MLLGGATAQGWADGRVRVLHPDGCASLRLPRGWGLGEGSGKEEGFDQPGGVAAAADAICAQDAAAICGCAAALLSGTAWPPRADLLNDASPEPDPTQRPSKLEPLPAAVWVRTNSEGQRWAELDPLEALSLNSNSPLPLPPPPAEMPPQPSVPAPGAPAKPPSAKAGANQSARAASPPGTGKAPGAAAKSAGEEKAADGKPQAAGAGAPRRSVEPRRSALLAAAAQDAPVDDEQPPPLAPRWLLLPPVPTESALDADTGCGIRARADGVLALAYPNGDRLLQDADGARIKFMPKGEFADRSKNPAGVSAALPESWAAEAAGCPAVTGSAAAMQVRACAYMEVHEKPCAIACCISNICSAVLPCAEVSVLLNTWSG